MTNHPKEKLVALTEPFSPEEYHDLKLVRKRFRELWDNFEDLKAAGFNLSGGFRQESCGTISTDVNLGVSRYRIKGYLVDYRHFSGDEPTRFFKIINTLKRRCSDISVRSNLERFKDDWAECSVLCGWHNDFSIDEVIEAAFKEEVFHTNPKGKQIRVRLDEVTRQFTQDVLWYELASVVFFRMLIIRNVNWMLQPVFEGKQFLRLPI